VAVGGRIEKFHKPLVFFLMPLDFIGLEIFPSSASTRRQAIHRLVPTPRDRSFVSRQKNKQNAVNGMISKNGKISMVM